jgi:uncharacterized membrane protein
MESLDITNLIIWLLVLLIGIIVSRNKSKIFGDTYIPIGKYHIKGIVIRYLYPRFLFKCVFIPIEMYTSFMAIPDIGVGRYFVWSYVNLNIISTTLRNI